MTWWGLGGSRVCVCSVASVMSESLQPYGLKPTRLLCPWDSPGRILEWVAMPFSRGSSQPMSPTLHADSLPAEEPRKPWVYTLFVIPSFKKHWLRKYNLIGSLICAIMDSGFVFSCWEVLIFSVERAGVLVSLLGVSQGLTVTLSQALWPCPAFALQEAEEQLLGGHQSICLG